VYVVALFAVVALGLASRRYPLFPSALGKYPGDALWALMVFLILGVAAPAASTRTLALAALGVSCLDELSQLYRAPWIDAVRSTTIGHLVLGSAFSWTDILSYSIGILVGAAGEGMVTLRR
jgi:hypothetical protein